MKKMMKAVDSRVASAPYRIGPSARSRSRHAAHVLSYVLAALLTLALSPAVATSISDVTIEELYTESAVVVSGVIQSGTRLANNCGVAYTVWIERGYKGVAGGTTAITFSVYEPLDVGARYYLFLGEVDRALMPIASTNSADQNLLARYKARCRSIEPPYVVNIFGGGALKITGVRHPAMERAVVFPEFLIRAPAVLEVVRLGEFDRYDVDRKSTAFDADAFSAYIDRLSGAVGRKAEAGGSGP